MGYWVSRHTIIWDGIGVSGPIPFVGGMGFHWYRPTGWYILGTLAWDGISLGYPIPSKRLDYNRIVIYGCIDFMASNFMASNPITSNFASYSNFANYSSNSITSNFTNYSNFASYSITR